MKVLTWEQFRVKRPDVWQLYPIGDVHLGNEAADERRFCEVVKEIAAEERALWLGMGDYIDLIQRSDPRFDPLALPKWLWGEPDLAGAQTERFLELVAPIASKCVGLVEGNHERLVMRRYERDVYSQIVQGVKAAGGFEPEHQLAFGVSGWLVLRFYMSEDKREAGHHLRINVHHGFVGGKLAGAKALNLQRWLWTHDADLVIFGHSHNSAVQVEAVEELRGNKVHTRHRIGMYSGTFMRNARYAEEKGYFPIPLTQARALLRPGAAQQRDRIRVVSCA